MKQIYPSFHGNDKRIALVVSSFNTLITDKLLKGAKECLLQHEVQPAHITTIYVPGSFELPFIAKKMAQTHKYDAIICLGAVIKGETAHFDYVCNQAAAGIAQVGYTTGIPTIFGVLTTDNLEQALARVGGKGSNKGWDAALSALALSSLCMQIDNEYVQTPFAQKERAKNHERN